MAERWKAWRQYPAFHRSLEISPNRRFPHFRSSGGGCFLLIGRGLRTTKTETVYTEILTPPDLRIHLSGLCDLHARSHRRIGMVLPSASHRGEPDQGGQQRCGVGRASLQSLGHELRALSTGHVGLQPELLVAPLQSGKDGRRSRNETRTTVDDATAFSFSGSHFLVPCRAGVGVSYSDHYEEKGTFQRLMDRLRSIFVGANGFAPVVPTALRC